MLDSLERIQRTERRIEKWLPPQKRKKRSRNTPKTFAEFFRQSWHVLEPSTDLLWNWHLEAICYHAQEIFWDWLKHRKDKTYQQRTQNLLINVPPGSAKSRIISVCFPAWIWTQYPSFKMIFLSANPRVALRDSVLCRDLIESEWYQNLYQPKWELRQDQNAKSSYWTSAGGFRNAGGFNSRITGDRADLLAWDDPHDAEEVNSDAKRLHVLERWDNAIRNRVNDPKSSIRMGIMQRLHREDLSGHVLKSGEWDHLCIEQEFETKRPPTAFGWTDPRTKPGELMFPDRFSAEFVAKEKELLGSAGYAGQHQQRPRPREGGLIKVAWVKRYNAPPAKFDRIIQSWDTASKASELNCPWSGTTWGIVDGNYYLLDVHTERHEYPDGKRAVVNFALKWSPNGILIEDKSTGTTLLQELRQGVVHNGRKHFFSLIPLTPHNDKLMRMSIEAIAFESGRVYLPEYAPWLSDYESVLFDFPASTISDPIDSTSQFLRWIREGGTSNRTEISGIGSRSSARVSGY